MTLGPLCPKKLTTNKNRKRTRIECSITLELVQSKHVKNKIFITTQKILDVLTTFVFILLWTLFGI